MKNYNATKSMDFRELQIILPRLLRNVVLPSSANAKNYGLITDPST